MSTILEQLTPKDLGLDFPTYRPIQIDAIEQAAYSDNPYQAMGLPPGAGKSLVAVSIAKLMGWRAAILTSTKGLQDQYSQTLPVTDIRGKANYACSLGSTCEDGADGGCPDLGTPACPYTATYNSAVGAPIVVTNYAYWLNIWEHGQGLGDFQCLILDEAVDAPEQLSRFLAIHLNERELHQLRLNLPPDTADFNGWWDWVNATRKIASGAIQDAKGQVLTVTALDRLKRFRRLLDRLSRFPITENRNHWVFEFEPGTAAGKLWKWDVIWPKRYGAILTRNIPRVILMSATLKKRVLADLGLPGEFREWGRIFPAERHPIYALPPRVNGKAIRIDRRTPADDLLLWVHLIDRIIDGRLDRKGLIHTVSFARQQYLLAHSRHRRIMIANTSGPDSFNAQQAAQRFRKAPAPAILVSPSFSVGWDFPRNECEWICIAKVPFPPAHSALMRARTQDDPDYVYYLALQEMVQSAGRGMRSMDDRAEVFITDHHCSWLLHQHGRLAPRWFIQNVFHPRDIPAPPPKL